MKNLDSQLALAEHYKRKLRVQEARLSKQAERAFRTAVQDLLVNFRDRANASPDGFDSINVKEELALALEPAKERAAAAITEAYNSGRSLGIQAVVAEMGYLGSEYRHTDMNSGLLAQALRDLRRNFDKLEQDAARTISASFQDESLRTPAQKLRKVSKDMSRLTHTMSRRAALSAQTAANRAFTDGQLSVRPVDRMRKMWVANFSAGTPCLTCSALHGSVIALTDTFDAERSYAPNPPRVYRDLAGPPRHPNCRCRIVLVPDPKEEEADKMQRFADKRVVKNIIEQGFTASQARSWPWTLVNRLTTALRSIFRRK